MMDMAVPVMPVAAGRLPGQLGCFGGVLHSPVTKPPRTKRQEARLRVLHCAARADLRLWNGCARTACRFLLFTNASRAMRLALRPDPGSVLIALMFGEEQWAHRAGMKVAV